MFFLFTVPTIADLSYQSLREQSRNGTRKELLEQSEVYDRVTLEDQAARTDEDEQIVSSRGKQYSTTAAEDSVGTGNG